MASDCYNTVKFCEKSAKEGVKLRKNVKKMHSFPANAPLEFVSIDILGELIRTPRVNRYLLVIVHRFSKLVRTVPLKRITAAAIGKFFTLHWIFFYGPPLQLLSDNGSKFNSRMFLDICRIMGI